MDKEEKEKKEPILIKYIKDRVENKNKNFLMLFVGSTGSGKSYSALRLAEMLDDKFNIDMCCFRAKDFMNKINELIEKSEQGEVIKGRVILWDEFGVEHNAREFMTISNRVINYFFQTSRHLNLIVLMSVPLLSFVDSATRKLTHSIAEMQGINQREKKASVKVKMLQTNVITGKEYPKYLRYRKGHKKFVSRKIRFSLPSKELLEQYEIKKKQFTAQLNKEIMHRLISIEDKEHKKTKPLTSKQEEFVELMKTNNVLELAKKLNVNKGTAYEKKKAIEKKGVVFKPIWENGHIIGHSIENYREKSPHNPKKTPY